MPIESSSIEVAASRTAPKIVKRKTPPIIQEFIAAIKKEDLKKAGIMLSSILKNKTISPSIKKAAFGMFEQLAKKPGYWENWDIAHTEVSIGLTGCTPLTATGPTIPIDEGDKYRDLGHANSASTPLPTPKPTTPLPQLTPAPVSSATPSIGISPSPSISPAPGSSTGPNPTMTPEQTPAPSITPPAVPGATPAPTPGATLGPSADPGPTPITSPYPTLPPVTYPYDDPAPIVISSIKLLIAQDRLEEAKTKAKEILAGNNSAFLKKRVLAQYLDALSKTNDNRETALEEAYSIILSWENQSKANPNASASIQIGIETYQGIEPLKMSADGNLSTFEDETVFGIWLSVKFEYFKMKGRSDEAAALALLLLGL